MPQSGHVKDVRGDSLGPSEPDWRGFGHLELLNLSVIDIILAWRAKLILKSPSCVPFGANLAYICAELTPLFVLSQSHSSQLSFRSNGGVRFGPII